MVVSHALRRAAETLLRSSRNGGVARSVTSRALREPWVVSRRLASNAPEATKEADSGLLSVLRTEIAHSRKSYSKPKIVQEGPPKNWTVTETPGRADVILRRSYGSEDIAVTCVYQKGQGEYQDDRDSEDEDDRDSEDSPSINLTITINKGDDERTLEISAMSFGIDLSIEHVYFWEDKASKEFGYDGPNFLDLDDELQNQFARFLKTRGVNKDVIAYLMATMSDKEEREYMRWLDNINAFIKK